MINASQVELLEVVDLPELAPPKSTPESIFCLM